MSPQLPQSHFGLERSHSFTDVFNHSNILGTPSMPNTVLCPGNQHNEQNRYGLCSPRVYSVVGKVKMNQMITVKSDKCHEVEISDVITGYILQENLILFRVSGRTSHYLRK